LKKLQETINKRYGEEQVKKFNAVFENIAVERKKTTNKKQFDNLLEKGIESAKLLCAVRIDVDTILASCCMHLVRKEFVVAYELGLDQNIIKLITDINKFESLTYDHDESSVDKLRAMFASSVNDIRTLIIKLAEVTVTAKQPESLSTEQKDHLHKEIKNIYAPLAARLGLSFIKSSLQDENFKYLQPKEYENLKAQVSKHSKERKLALNKIIRRLKKALKDLNINGEVYGRVKHLSSIYKKLNGRANGDLKNVHDLAAARIITQNVNDCYAVLGTVHSLYTPVENRFKDYIAKPKANGYRSLHTTVHLDNKEVIEVQIRTQAMHDLAEYGIAAHWLYKEKPSKQNTIDKKLTWMRQIIENADSLSAEEMINELQTDVYESEIYVQTPKGEIIALPTGSTPIDFAYSIHTEVGNKCVGAKVNNKMVPLSTTLNNGEIVEIITSSSSKGPSRDWLKYVKSVEARNKINGFFKKEFKEENIKKGKHILEQAAKSKGLKLYKLLEQNYVKDLLNRYSLSGLEDMYASVGHGSLTATQIITKLTRLEQEHNLLTKKELTIKPTVNNQPKTTSKDDAIIVKGLNNLLTRLAKCCTPIPGDKVVGYVSRGKGATIHRSNCKTLKQLENERLINAEWGETKGVNYQAEINVIIKNTKGALATITNKIAENDVNIVGVSSNKIAFDSTLVTLIVSITKKIVLEELIKKLKSVKAIEQVYRRGER
jgi:GTP pyrophosphokinase